MSAHSDRAVELFKQGFNCSQAVFAAFCDEFDMDEETALKVSAGLGGGVGRLREVCGTVTGASMVAGMLYGATDGNDHEKKALTYQKVQQIVDEFKKLNPSIVCRELLGLSPTASTPSTPEHRTDEFYKKRPCAQLVEDSARAVDKILFGIED
ncbi:MAG: C_GCAxxG_C_C family protein [Clostridia bacterium]|nr:C_GCAxxG_C_C family protein [Clostridia bacterium]